MRLRKRISKSAKTVIFSTELRHAGDLELTADDLAALARSAEDVIAVRFASDAQVRDLVERIRRA